MEKIIFEENKTIIVNEPYFNILATLDCGQAFRWNGDCNQVKGVAYGKVLSVTRQDNNIEIIGCNKQEYENTFKKYFDFGFDYVGLINDYKHDKHIYEGANFAYGLRLLNQQKFETIISFIISANNNVKRIKGIIERICSLYGDEIEDGYFSFPTAHQLKGAKTQDFERIGAGYRGDYLYNTIKAINDGFDIDSIVLDDYNAAKKQLCTLKGIGPKVADCILLYSYGYRNAFPIDVWMQKIMEKCYFNGEKVSKKQIEKYVNDNFGQNAGVLQLLLFNYARNAL